MGIGIQICGLNGSGKSTLGKALAERTGFHFIDNENLFFVGRKTDEPYTNPNSREEVERLLMKEVSEYPNFIFAAVKGDYGKEILLMYSYVIVIEIPKEIRLQRVRNRSFQKFGDRMLTGGDLYKQEEAFFRMAESRNNEYVENWVRSLKCPVIRIDGTKAVNENVEHIIQKILITEIGSDGYHDQSYGGAG